MLLLAVLVGCGGGGGDGAAPTITDLALAPQSVPVAVQSTITGTMTFDDVDGDVEQIAVAVTTPGGARQEVPPAPIQTTGEPEHGVVQWALLLSPPAAGTYTLELWVIDGSDNASNHLTSDVIAQ